MNGILTIENPPKSDVLNVVFDDEIFDRQRKDGDPLVEDLINPDLSHWDVLAGYVNGEVASTFIVIEGKLHFYCLKLYREHARELLKDALEAYGQTIQCEIPVLYREVINFAKNNGFKKIGQKAAAWPKNGIFYDVEILEWAGFSEVAAVARKPHKTQQP